MRKMLIVDDNALFRKALRASLHSQFPSLVVSEAKDGTEALETIPTFLPHMILMDIHLSNESGLELTRSIKGLFPDIKVILLTSYDLPEYQKAAFQYKADHCMSKDSFLELMNLNLILSEGPVGW